MTLTRVKTIRGLERGLSVFRLLHQVRAASLHQLHERSGLPKATLERILLTLQREGFATRRLADDCWVPGYSGRALSNRFAPSDRLSQAAAPVLDKLCRRVLWPSDLSVRIGTHMELKETSRPHSTLTLNHLAVGFPINMLLSAPGRAYLSFCPADERDIVLKRLRSKRGAGYSLAKDDASIARILAETCKNGFAARDPTFGGHITKSKTKYDDGLNAIAVPIMQNEKVLGCINIVWIRRLITETDMASRHLCDLQEAAAEIAASYQTSGFSDATRVVSAPRVNAS
jgi:IclR family mhp operon transcriptional activator